MGNVDGQGRGYQAEKGGRVFTLCNSSLQLDQSLIYHLFTEFPNVCTRAQFSRRHCFWLSSSSGLFDQWLCFSYSWAHGRGVRYSV